MPNISLTRRCARDCGYCFARGERGNEAADEVDMPSETFENALNFLKRSGVKEARLLGGEPTLHPQFFAFVDRALEGGFSVMIFTGGLFPDGVLAKLESLAGEDVHFLLNAALPGVDKDELVRTQKLFCRALGPQITLGFNLCSTAPDLAFLLDWVERFGLKREIRLGIAHPIWRGRNESLRPQQRKRVGDKAADFAMKAWARGIEIDFDCGWTPCMFPEGFLEAHGDWRGALGIRCNPIVDVMPEGVAIHCYALSHAPRFNVDEFQTRDALSARFSETMAGYRLLGAYKECATCAHRRAGDCVGGCLSAAMGRIRSAGAPHE